jgi:hypothetical protein
VIWGVNHQHLLEDPDAVIQGGRMLHLRYPVRRPAPQPATQP